MKRDEEKTRRKIDQPEEQQHTPTGGKRTRRKKIKSKKRNKKINKRKTRKYRK